MKKYSKIKRNIRYFQVSALACLIASSPFAFASNSVVNTTLSGALGISQQGDPSISTPKNGQKKDNVEANFGTPLQKVGAVGVPPISRWIYQDFTVYFEDETVLHSVVHKS